MTGIGHYFGDIVLDEGTAPLGAVSMLAFIFFVILFEVINRLRNRISLGHVKTPITI